MLLRRSLPSDIDRIMEILNDGKKAIANLGIDQWQSGYLTRELIACDVERGVSYLAVNEDGHKLGTLVIDFGGDATYDSIDGSWLSAGDSTQPDYSAIHRIAVAAEAARSGVARFMMAEAVSLSREAGCVSVRVDTHAGNIPMRNLVLQSGFSERGVVLLPRIGEPTRERTAYELLL